MVLRIRQSVGQALGTPYRPLDLTRWHPRIGERVLALGFADLDLDRNDGGDNRPMSQYLYGSLAAIVDVERADGARWRQWPQFRVEADWPGGMSGGPVFNEPGHVVGVISAAVAGQGVASATYFSGWDIPERIFGSIDSCNPGWFRCYAVFNGDGALAKCSQDRTTLKAFARDYGLSEVAAISLNFETGDYVRI
jgi:serine protease Do